MCIPRNLEINIINNLNLFQISVEGVQIGKTMDLEEGIGLNVVDGWVGTGISNLGLLLPLEPFKKFVLGGG